MSPPLGGALALISHFLPFLGIELVLAPRRGRLRAEAKRRGVAEGAGPPLAAHSHSDRNGLQARGWTDSGQTRWRARGVSGPGGYCWDRQWVEGNECTLVP